MKEDTLDDGLSLLSGDKRLMQIEIRQENRKLLGWFFHNVNNLGNFNDLVYLTCPHSVYGKISTFELLILKN